MFNGIHPGIIFADEIAELGLNASQTAKALGVPANRITQVLKGTRAITADTALRLSCWLGTTPEFWMNLQQTYELKLAAYLHGKDIKKVVKSFSHHGSVSTQR